MELTTIWQMLNQAYLGTDSYGAKMYIRIYARYTEQNENNLTTTVQYQARSYFDKNWSIYDRQSNGSISGTGATTSSFSRSADYTGGEISLATIEGTVNHDENTGEASITASATLNFPNWGWSATASGSATLPTIETSTLRIGVNGSWKKATPYLGVNGVWKKCKAYLGVNGSWKKGE